MIQKPFQGLRTFCKIPDNDVSKDFVVIGYPLDVGCSFRPGTRFGPSAIREASMMLTDGEHPYYQMDISRHVTDLGDASVSTDLTTAIKQIEDITTNILDHSKHPISFGGEHTITLGILRAMNKMYNKVAVIHLDAHSDTWKTNFDEPIGHGTWLYNAIEEGLVDPTRTVSIGVRSPTDSFAANYLFNRGGRTFSAREALRDLDEVLQWISVNIQDYPVYLSLDIDSLDPAYAPGTGTPEIGGLTSMWVLELMERLNEMNWIGMDVVEVSPPYDHSQITALAAATFAWTYLSMVVHKSVVGLIPCGDGDDITIVDVDQQALIGPTGPTT